MPLNKTNLRTEDSSDIIRLVYTPPAKEKTCKNSFQFDLIRRQNRLFIKDMSISGNKGCAGHPKTIAALLKDRDLADVPCKLLEATNCGKDYFSCGQQLAKAIQAVRMQTMAPGRPK
jgi:hypothetical protein